MAIYIHTFESVPPAGTSVSTHTFQGGHTTAIGVHPWLRMRRNEAAPNTLRSKQTFQVTLDQNYWIIINIRSMATHNRSRAAIES